MSAVRIRHRVPFSPLRLPARISVFHTEEAGAAPAGETIFASIAQWTERRSTEPGIRVRLLIGAPVTLRARTQSGLLNQTCPGRYRGRVPCARRWIRRVDSESTMRMFDSSRARHSWASRQIGKAGSLKTSVVSRFESEGAYHLGRWCQRQHYRLLIGQERVRILARPTKPVSYSGNTAAS